ncbi:GWxTD domain-containing protein [Gemmatimonadota bacterium]
MSSRRTDHRARNIGTAILTALLAGIIVMAGGTRIAYGQQEWLISQSFTGEVQTYVDVVSYRNLQDPSQTYVEIYYAFDRKNLTFIELPDAPGTFSSLWTIETVVETEIGDRVKWESWPTFFQTTDPAETEAPRTIFDIYRLYLAPGTYRFITTVTDKNSQLQDNTRIGVDRRTVVIPDFSSSQLTISDIEFTVRLGQAASPNKFVKNGLLVIPNPLRVFGLNFPTMSFYAEVYGLSDQTGAAGEQNTYTRSIYIEGLNIDHRHVFEDRVTKAVRANNDLIAISDLNPLMIPSGAYNLYVEIVDNATGQRAVRRKPFNIFSEVQSVEADELRSINMTTDAVVRLRNEIAYLATREELEEYDRLDSDGKRTFLINFWTARDTTPGTVENEFRQTILQRFNHANDNFVTPTQPEGWKTDQGRIWIVYGIPDDIEPHTMDIGNKPWVEWIYNQLEDQGRRMFIFADTSGGFGAYILIHSDVAGEMQNPQWKEELGIPPR